MRNRIERWFGILKAKLRPLLGGFPLNTTINTITRYPHFTSFLAAFAAALTFFQSMTEAG